MKTKNYIGWLLVAFMLIAVQQVSAQSNYYFPKAGVLDSKIPSPEQYLG